jgi:Ca-activated chloride channel family protein
MSFIWPALLLLLLIAPLLIAWYLWMQRRRRRLVERYGNMGFAQRAGVRPAGVRRHLPAVLFLIALTVLIIALARPQATIGLPRVEGTVILAFDVSGSMAADDMAPNRIEVAKAAARDFVARQPPTVRIGVVAFSDSGFAVQPPTRDEDAILMSINRLAPARGTSLANGILASLNAIAAADAERPPTYYTNQTPEPTPTPTPVPAGTFSPATIVLLTDGENTAPPEPMLAAQVAAERGVRVHTIGIGSPQGATLNIDGFLVRTQLDETALQAIAQLTGGAYFNAQNAEQLREIYANLGTHLVIRPEETEITALVAGLGLLILLIGGLLSLAWFSRLP